MDTTLGTSAKDKIAMAMDILTSIRKKDIEQLCYRVLKRFVWDMENDLRAERLKEWTEGCTKGWIKGWDAGSEERTFSITMKLLKMNLSLELIQEATGLTPSEIEELRK